jgi:hypothetical protein
VMQCLARHRERIGHGGRPSGMRWNVHAPEGWGSVE